MQAFVPGARPNCLEGMLTEELTNEKKYAYHILPRSVFEGMLQGSRFEKNTPYSMETLLPRF